MVSRNRIRNSEYLVRANPNGNRAEKRMAEKQAKKLEKKKGQEKK